MHDVAVSALALLAVGLWGALRLQACQRCHVPLPVWLAVFQLVIGDWTCGPCRREESAADRILAEPAGFQVASSRINPELVRRHEELRAKLAVVGR